MLMDSTPNTPGPGLLRSSEDLDLARIECEARRLRDRYVGQLIARAIRRLCDAFEHPALRGARHEARPSPG
jgi:hypothetical protein